MSSNLRSDSEPPEMARENELESTKSSSESSAKRRKLETCSPYIAPPCFWDNLSKLTICRRALWEFDRRTKRLVALPPPKNLHIKTEEVAKLQRFARQGGPSLLDLRGYSRLSTRSSIADPHNQGADTMVTINVYDAAFAQHLADNGISLANRLPGGGSRPPSNHAEIQSRLAPRRRSLSPSVFPDAEYERFMQQNDPAENGNSVMKDVFPLITGRSDIPHSGGFAFKNLKPLTDVKLQHACPESYDGCRPGELDRSVREQLGGYIVPLSNTSVPCLPTFFTECKGPTEPVPVGERQILYAGTLGARGVHQLKSFIDPTTALDNNAYVISVLYCSATGSLFFYAVRPIPSQNPQLRLPLEYPMTLIKHFHLADSPENFREGVTAYRNAREWAQEKRDELVRAANAKARSSSLIL